MERIEISSLLTWGNCKFDDGEHEWFQIKGRTLGKETFSRLVANNGPLMYKGYEIDSTQDLWWVYHVVLAEENINEAIQKCPKGKAKPIPEHIRKRMQEEK